MNDDELDELRRAITPPKGLEELIPPQTLPLAELVVFAALVVTLLVWALGVLSQIFLV